MVFLSSSVLVFVAYDYITFDKQSIAVRIHNVTGLIQMPQLAFESAKLEPRLGFLKRVKTNRVYPEMLPVDHLDYVYAQ